MKREKITLTKSAEYSHHILLTPFFLLLTLAGVIIISSPAAAEGTSAGFFYDHFRLTLEPGDRTEAAGPFYYCQQTDTEHVWAIPPFFSRIQDPSADRDEENFLYPLMTRTRYGNERRWQLFELINTGSGHETDESNTKRFTIFPLYFQQRSEDTNLNYTAVVPFYGRLEHRLFKDEIYFILFPGYVETRKRDVVTKNYFYPFVDVRHGDGLEGWQFWPFAGHEHKDVTTLTNGFGDTSQVPGHDTTFYAWPFYVRQTNGIGSDNPESLHASIPLYDISRSPQRDVTSIFWPFFTSIDDRGQKYHEWQGPWPFVIYTRGEGKHTSRIFPLFSVSHNATRETDSYVWPLYVFTHVRLDPLDEHRTRIVYYLYDRLSQKNTETGQERVRVDMWPFFMWHHELNGDTRLQVLTPLEPLVPDNPGIERNWSPLWALWRSENNAKTGATSQSLLWNLYRRDTAPDYKKVSAFFGLYQHEAEPDAQSLRLFYIPVSGPHK
jgi:hypothetical protein